MSVTLGEKRASLSEKKMLVRRGGFRYNGCVILPGAGHMLPVEYREQAAPLVADWLKRHLALKPIPAAKAAPAAEPLPAGGEPAPAAKKRAVPRRRKTS
ncbi:MAG TPA: hypothetical protein VFU32_04060 [Ktedonobacterales bacterium]|nr:hypothetical protein [Ktedonobacterales bacterium]